MLQEGNSSGLRPSMGLLRDPGGGGWGDDGHPTHRDLDGSGAFLLYCAWGLVQMFQLVPYGKFLWGGSLLKVRTGLPFCAPTELVRFLRSSILGWTSRSRPKKASKFSVVIQKPNSEPLRLVFRIWESPSKNNSPFPLLVHHS